MKTRTGPISLLLLALAASLMLLLAPAAMAAGDDPVTDVINPSVRIALDAAGPNEAIPVLVYAPGSTGALIGNLPIPYDAVDLAVIGAVSVQLTGDQITAVAALPYVTSIQADNSVFQMDTVDTMSVTNATIGLGQLTQPEAGGPTGAGIGVAILDSGTDYHADLASGTRRNAATIITRSRIVAFKDFTSPFSRRLAYDDAGHGTFVAGVIAGDGWSSKPTDLGGTATTQFRGVAPEANIISIKVLNKFGQGRSSDVIAGIQWAIDNASRYNIRVMNISVAGNVPGATEQDPMALAVEAAWNAGIVVVCAAGNEGEFGLGSIQSPGNDPYVITVGALDTRQTPLAGDDAVAGYSSFGPTLYDEFAKPDLVAPGNRLISLRSVNSYIDKQFKENRIPVSDYDPTARRNAKPDYFKLSGTSAAAPVVAGTIALMIQQDPSLTPDDIKLRLLSSADPVLMSTPEQQGAGTVDVPGALAATDRASGPTLSADLGNGTTILTDSTYVEWEKYAWTKYAWTKYAWTKYAWTKYAWTTIIQGQ